MVDCTTISLKGAQSQVSVEQQSLARHWVQLVSGGIGGLAAWPFTPRYATASSSPIIPIYRLVLASAQQSRLRSPTHLATFSSAPIPALFTSAKLAKIRRHGIHWKLIAGPLGLSVSTATSFFIYDFSKQLGAEILHSPADTAVVHAQAAMMAGLATPSIMNSAHSLGQKLVIALSSTIGIKGKNGKRWPTQEQGTYRRHDPSHFRYIDAAKLTIHLVLYEKIKHLLLQHLALSVRAAPEVGSEADSWAATSTAAGCAQLIAVLATHPLYKMNAQGKELALPLKEAKTQLPFVSVAQKVSGLYVGLFTNLLRSVPSAIATFGVYEFIVRTMV